MIRSEHSQLIGQYGLEQRRRRQWITCLAVPGGKVLLGGQRPWMVRAEHMDPGVEHLAYGRCGSCRVAGHPTHVREIVPRGERVRVLRA
jgi:hypothetical protein